MKVYCESNCEIGACRDGVCTKTRITIGKDGMCVFAKDRPSRGLRVNCGPIDDAAVDEEARVLFQFVVMDIDEYEEYLEFHKQRGTKNDQL